MDTAGVPVVLAAAAAVLVVGWLRADRRDARAAARPRPAGAVRSPATRPRSRPPRHPDAVVLAGPPLVAGGATLRDWLVHFHPGRRNVWAEVAAEYFAALAARPDIADYFGGADRGALQKHFLGAVITLTGTGVTAGTLEALRSRHRAVRNSRGDGITGEVFDGATGLLVDVLAARQVPAPALDQLRVVVGVLRDAVVDPASAVVSSGRHARVEPAGPARVRAAREQVFARARSVRPTVGLPRVATLGPRHRTRGAFVR